MEYFVSFLFYLNSKNLLWKNKNATPSYIGLIDSINCNIDDTRPYNDFKGILHWEFETLCVLQQLRKITNYILFPQHLFFVQIMAVNSLE